MNYEALALALSQQATIAAVVAVVGWFIAGFAHASKRDGESLPRVSRVSFWLALTTSAAAILLASAAVWVRALF